MLKNLGYDSTPLSTQCEAFLYKPNRTGKILSASVIKPQLRGSKGVFGRLAELKFTNSQREELTQLSWTNINLKEVNPAQLDLVAAGTYTFALNTGAKYNERGAILASATIESDGDFRGKKMLFSYPDPESTSRDGKVQTWASVALKRLEVATGSEVEEGEDPVSFLNRIAGAKFAASVTVKDDETGTKRSNIQLLNVKPAA